MIALAALLGHVLLAPPIDPIWPTEFRAVWVATVDNIDWPARRDLSTAQQKASLLAIMNQAEALHLNAIIFQVRPHADALYASRFEPWSEYLTGRQGRAPEPMWDPLEFAVTEAHKRGIELHAWFNPYRAWHPAAKGSPSADSVVTARPSAVRTYGQYKWMDPSDPWVQQRSLDVMLDVVKRYDVDGVHIDDYFYPYPIKDASGRKIDFPDQENFDRYVSQGGMANRGDWRRLQVDDFIERLYRGIKSTKRWVKFGISPFGIYRPGVPAGITSGVDQYAELYADARKWLVEGWCDYFTPQLYWEIAKPQQSFRTLFKWWREQNPTRRHLWPGLYTGRIHPADGKWEPKEVLDQIAITRQAPNPGTAHFSMKVFASNSKGITDRLREGPYKKLALVPASPWLDAQRPTPPRVSLRDGHIDVIEQAPDAHFTVLAKVDGNVARVVGVWDASIRNQTLSRFHLTESGVESMGLATVDRAGNISVVSPLKH